MIHIFPVGETHTEETTCNCYPRIKEENGEIICIHQSYNALELVEEGFQIGAKTGVNSRCGRELIEGDIVESIQGNRFMVITLMGIKPYLMLPNKELFRLDKAMAPNLFYIGNVVDDLRIRSLFFYGK